MKCFVKNLTVACILSLGQIALAQTDRVKYNDQNLFLSGANLAWFNFAGDLGPTPTAFASFEDVLLQMHDNGGNALRWWLHTNGTVTPQFDNAGFVSGPGSGAIDDLRTVLDLAWEREVGLKLCLWSFDMLRSSHNATVLNRNRLMLTDTAYAMAYIRNSLIPMVEALKGHPAIIAWEIFNEPEGMSDEFGWAETQHVPMSAIQRFVNLCAGAIHRTDTTAQVTNGTWSFLALTDVGATSLAKIGAELTSLSAAEKLRMEKQFFQKYGFAMTVEEIRQHLQRAASYANFNYYADARLVAAGGDPLGTLDFYSVHYYDNFGVAISPFHSPASKWALDKPLVIAEFAMRNTFGVLKEDLFKTLFNTGYAGALPWSWTDTNFSSRVDMLAGMKYMWDNFRPAVDVNGIGGDWPLVSITSPANDAVFPDGATVTIEATASDNDGIVASVEFFASDTLKIGEVTASPYTITWSNITPGIYTLTAVATDDRGHKRISNRVPIRVGTPQITRLEAERATRTGTPAILNDATASNRACLRMQQTGTITWQVGVTAAGTYEIVFGYRLPYDTPKNQFLNINGVRVGEVSFTGALNTWLERKVNVALAEGNNSIQIELSWGWMDLDYLGVPSSILTSVAEHSETPFSFSLQQNYPNPFNPATTIRYSIAKTERVKLAIYDAQGRQVQVLLEAEQNAGAYVIPFDARRLASGVYFYRIEAGVFVDEKRMLLVK